MTVISRGLSSRSLRKDLEALEMMQRYTGMLPGVKNVSYEARLTELRVRHRTRGSKTERRRDKEEVPDTIQEPLRWFGVLVPQCLRVAQHSFTEVMELAAEITTLQCRVLEVKAQYQKLRGQKEGAPGS
ncbi:coiled-coil domain-containing protein 115 isoform X2 [Narcine bancroftii]|uniref:coiled-coil domain-containing protein 115 isoform X2 n=1 Tax=Narcine bancroftii TaxID=1343680 RepID=UPI003831F6C7